MRDREATSGRKAGRRDAADVPEKAYKSTEEALMDLRSFVSGQEHMPDLPLQMDAIVQDLSQVLDDEVLASFEVIFEDAIFSSQVKPHDDVMDSYVSGYQLLKKLRDLQKTRLRDAIARACVQRKS